MKKVIVMMLLTMMIAGCGGKVRYFADIDDDVDSYVLPKGMKFVSYDADYRNIILRKARQGEEPEEYYVFSSIGNSDCKLKFVER